MLVELLRHARERKVRKTDFILDYVQTVEDQRGEELEFIPITVLHSDKNVVDGGPRRNFAFTGLNDEGGQDERLTERKAWVHSEFDIKNRQQITVWMTGHGCRGHNAMSDASTDRDLDEQYAFWHRN